MGGLGPGIGGMEYLLIAIVALVVLGPERLPGMLNKLGKWVAKARNMANEFRASFDEMARQSELDELRKEVEALRRGQGMVPLGAEADAAFRDIRDEMNRPLPSLAAPTAAVDEWPDSAPAKTPPKPEPAPPASKARKPDKPGKTTPTGAPSKTKAAMKSGAKTTKPRTPRKKAVDL